ncbi:hypothetical protein [Hansschlegelia sp.]|uniref:hypothetical protein n=1 Tax=Hansschlegelia sp. TaxID=2041892 RepID=UPI002BF7BA78|nr:hypothetical protein [Hansschlegelia sp.]HVI27126.1 hypothetical protein [Hansschlegelia sp.]
MRAFALAALFPSALLLTAAAPESQPAGRYQLQPTDGGFLRLDRDTGATAFCSPSGEGYACRAASEEPAANGAEVARLEKRLAALEEQVRALTRPAAAAPKDGPAESDGSLRLPSDEEIGKVTSFLERALRRLKELGEQMQKEEPSQRERL